MARTKKTRFEKEITKAMARDRKRVAEKKMRVSGKGVFTLARLQGSSGDSKKTR